MTNKYEAIGLDMLGDEERARAATVEFAAGTTPEREAEAVSLSQRTGAPVDAVRADPDGARKEAERRRLAALSPTTQRWLTENPNRYALVKDDVEGVNRLGLTISRTFEAARDFGLSSGWRTLSDHLQSWDTISDNPNAAPVFRAAPDPFYAEEIARSLFAGYERGVGNAGFVGLPDLRSAETRQAAESVARGLGYESDAAYQAARTGGFIAGQERRAQQIERTSEATDQAFAKIAAANETDSVWEALGLVWEGRRAVGTVIGQSLGMGAPGLAMTAATGGTSRLATAATAGGSSGFVEYGASISEALSEAGVDVTDSRAVTAALRNPAIMEKARDRATKRGVTIGLFDAVTAGLAGQLLINARRGVSSAALRTGGEVGIQAGGGAAGELTAQVVAGDDIKLGDIILEGVAELPFAAVEGRANYVTARERGQVRWINEQLDIVRRSSSGAEALAAATAAAAESNLGQRSPAEAQAFARAAGAEGAVYIDAEVARTLFQSDWQVLVDAVGGDAALTEQLAAGDVAIPADQYFGKIAQLPYAADIARNARVQADALSAVEMESFDIDALADALAGDTSEAAERATPGQPTTRQRVQEDVYGQLISTGRYTDAAAQAQAKLWGAFFASMESRYGTDGWAAYEQRMRGIGTGRADGSADPRSTRPWLGDGKLDALLDAIRSDAGPPQSDIMGPSLSAFVQGLGGISDDTGELRGMDAGRLRIGLINAQGVPLDRAREAAAEMGYLPMDSDINDLLDLLDRDLRDGDVFSEQLADRRRVEFETAKSDLQAAIDDNEYLRSLSNDEFRALTNQQIADALFGGSMLDQAEPGSFNNPLPESEMESAPVGAWVAGPALPGLDTRRQIMDVPLDRIDATEFDSADQLAPEKRADAERYAEAMRAGEQFPNGRGSELPSGMIKLQDGHRRFAAARAAGAESMRLAVSPLSLAQAANFDQPASDFESRFGDSKVVDDQGQPLLVYHGTGRDFTEFRMGSAPGWGRGVYFTDNRDQAEADYGGGAGGRVVEAYLSIRNPWRGGFPGYEEVESTQAWQGYTGSFEDSLDAWNEDGGFAGEVLRELGYDGVIAENSNDIRGLEIVAFDTAQIIPAAERDAQQQFDESAFRPAVVSWAKGTYGDAIAPNGRPVWQNFTAWFGDSKVVDAEGRPLVTYHSTTFGDFDTFNRGEQRKGMAGFGFYFSDQDGANIYADYGMNFQADQDWRGNPKRVNVMPSFLAASNPLVVDNISDVSERYGRRDPGAFGVGRKYAGLSDDALTAIERDGYDGVITNEYVKRQRDGSYKVVDPDTKGAIKHPVYVVFQPEQIKSATGNRGNFDPADPSILNQPAFHGTPHDVDRFSLQKIGSGEGNQAFGWGLYFASQRDIADFYRRNLTGIARNIPATMGDDALREAGGDRGRAIATLTRRRDALPEAARGDVQAAIDWLRRGQNTGRLYQVEVPDSDVLLDWDTPLSEQPEKVWTAINGADFNGNEQVARWRRLGWLDDVTGKMLYGALVGDTALTKRIGLLQQHSSAQKAASEYLLSIGIPGLRYLDGDSRGSGGTHNYVIWDESAVSEPVRLNQSAINAPTFYSAALAAIESGRGAPKRGDAQAWKGWLDGAQRRGEMRQSERDWLGIDAWLDAQEGPVTREALAEFVRANQVQVSEVMLGEGGADALPDALPDGWTIEQDSDGEYHDTPGLWVVLDDNREPRGFGSSRESAINDAQDPDDRAEAEAAGLPKFAAWQLPGGENYRELLLTLPTKDGDDPLAGKTREELGRLYEAEIGYNPIEDDPSISTEQLREDVRSLGPAAVAAGTSVGTGISGGRYQSSHFDQPNILAHVRFNERTDADGKRVLFLEEIQSDWHQEGRKKGYGTKLIDGKDHAYWRQRALDLRGGDPAAYQEAAANRDALQGRNAGVPDAPFKTTDEWAMLAFKRMVRYAVDNGFERIAWTTGEQQAARYDLSKQVDTIAYAKDADGLVTIEVFKDGRNQFNRRGMSMEEVEATFGKEVAQKIADDGGELNMRTGYSELSGLDLQVGGEGMRAFYDKILPSAVNKWGKRFGAKVGRTRLANETATSERNDDLALLAALDQDVGTATPTEGAEVVHAIDITPAMREAAAQGMTLFQSDTPEFERWSRGAPVVAADEMWTYGGGEAVFEVYHGTTANFDAFDRAKANPESDMGSGFYFTNNEDDVGTNYAGIGPDLENKIQREAERIAGERDLEYDDPDVVAEARARWVQNDGVTLPVYVRTMNPAIVGGPYETQLTYEESFNEDTDEYGDPEGTLIDVVEAMRAVSSNFDELDVEVVISDIMERGYEGISMSEMVEVVKASEGAMYATDQETGDMAVGEFIRQALEEAGFDAIVDYTVDMKFGSQRQTGRSMEGMTDETVHVIAFQPTQIKSSESNSGAFDPSNPSIYGQRHGSAPRGQIQIYPDRSMAISLFEKADRSTFLHETGHFFLEVLRDMAAADDAPQQARDDMAALLSWFGVESADQIAVEHHEQFARGFEKYLGEGRAPSPELQSAFSQFKAWLLSVYRSLVNLNVNLTDDVRGVMDRMLAADEEIEAAHVRQGMEPLAFADGVLEEAQIRQYADQLTAATERERAALGARLMAAHDRAARRWYKEQKAEVRKEVEAEYSALPVYRAARALAGAKTFADGTPIPDELRGMKLDRDALVAVYGEAYLQRIRGLYAREGGVDQDVAAMRLGFESGDALLNALANREDMAARVAAETDARMVERYGDPMVDGTLPERAMEAVHGDHRMRVLAWEMAVLEALAADPLAVPDAARPVRAQEGQAERPRPQVSPETRARIREAQGRRTAATRALAEVARRSIAKKTLREIRPNDYLVAERKAAVKAAAASARGSYAEALQAKRQQAFNAAMYRQAKAAQARAESNVRFLRKASSDATRARIGKQAGKFYVDALDAIFHGIEVRGVSRPQVARRAALRDWVRRMQDEGNSTAVPEILLARVESENVTNLADMTVGDVEGLREAVGNILHLARTKNRLLTAKGQRDWEDVKAEMMDRLEQQPDRHGRTGISDADRKLFERISDLYAAGSNWVLQPETLVEWLDGATTGPFHDLLWDQAQAAERKREALNRAVGGKLQEALDALPAADRKALDRRFHVESLGGDVSGHSILSALLNMGNAGNRDKLTRGGRVVGDEIVPFTPEQLADMFAKLTRPQAEMVQKVWDAIDTLWPEIVALEESMNGIAPERVESTPVTVITRDGPVALRGGYYPAMYDPKGARAGQFSEDEQAKRVLSGQTPIRASTSKGHTEKRTDFAAPLLLDYQAVLTRHLDGVIGDIAYRQFLRQVYKVLGDADIRRMIDNRVGPGAAVGLRKGFERGATGNFSLAGPLLGPFQRVADATMTNLSSAALGFRIPLALANVVAVPLQAAARVPYRYVLRGLRDYYLSGGANLIGNMRRNAEMVQRLSPLMLRRSEARSVELSSIIANLRGQRGFRAKMIEMAMSVHQWTVPLAENAIWMGAYQQAADAGATPTEAVTAADKAIRQTQTKTSAAELSQGEGGYMRMFMQFAGPLVIMNNRMQEAGLRGLRGDVHSWPQALGVWFAVAMGAAWSFELIMGRGPDADDDGEDPDVVDWVAWAAKKLALLPFAAFPMVRDAASYLDSGFSRSTPLVESMKSVIDTFGGLAESLFGDEEVDAEKVTKQAVRAAGVATGVPSNQLLRTGDYLMSVSTGEHEMGNPAAEAYYLVQGAPDED